MVSLFDTIEAEAWSRGFSYEDYQGMFLRVKGVHSKFSKETYKTLCNLLSNIMEEEMALGIDNGSDISYTDFSLSEWPKTREAADLVFGNSAWFCKACQAYHGQPKDKEEIIKSYREQLAKLEQIEEELIEWMSGT